MARGMSEGLRVAMGQTAEDAKDAGRASAKEGGKEGRKGIEICHVDGTKMTIINYRNVSSPAARPIRTQGQENDGAGSQLNVPEPNIYSAVPPDSDDQFGDQQKQDSMTYV